MISITIIGTNFSGASSVTFNGTTASMTVNRDTQITAVVPAGASTGNIVVTIATGYAASTIPFTINPLPTVAVVRGTATVCANDAAILSTATPAGVWSSATTTVATITGSGVVSGVSAGTSLISYTVTDGNGCINKITATITVNPKPVVAVVTGTTSVCVGANTTLSNTTSPGVWTNASTIKATINLNGLVTGVAGGTYLISNTLTEGNCCNTTVTRTLTLN